MANLISAQQELQTKKILEDLQLKKKLLLSTNSNNSMPQYNPQVIQAPVGSQPEKEIVNNSSRTALQQAQAVSFGYFVSQNSSFGNLILPVLPAFDNHTPPTSQPPPTTK
ncbi:SOSS complex subunit C homolog B [Culicoides brevitarsis]|uniref:SOSS complex subunit C homolog B n=1 Tax=Culicoides brevitarsis TaxID=469753 RepID=UPI00307C7259